MMAGLTPTVTRAAAAAAGMSQRLRDRPAVACPPGLAGAGGLNGRRLGGDTIACLLRRWEGCAAPSLVAVGELVSVGEWGR